MVGEVLARCLIRVPGEPFTAAAAAAATAPQPAVAGSGRGHRGWARCSAGATGCVRASARVRGPSRGSPTTRTSTSTARSSTCGRAGSRRSRSKPSTSTPPRCAASTAPRCTTGLLGPSRAVLVQEYVPGETLHELTSGRPPLDKEQARRIAVDVLRGLPTPTSGRSTTAT